MTGDAREIFFAPIENGTGEIILGDHVYRTDYFDHSRGLALMEEIEAFLAGCTPVSVTTD